MSIDSGWLLYLLPFPHLPAHDASVLLLTKNISTRISFVLRTRVSRLDTKKISFSVVDENDKMHVNKDDREIPDIPFIFLSSLRF